MAVCCCNNSLSSSVRLHLVEQPHVLDRDHRLVGERGKQLDVPVAEWPHLERVNLNDADGNSLRAGVGLRASCGIRQVFMASFEVGFRISQDIWNMNYLAFENSLPDQGTTSRDDRILDP